MKYPLLLVFIILSCNNNSSNLIDNSQLLKDYNHHLSALNNIIINVDISNVTDHQLFHVEPVAVDHKSAGLVAITGKLVPNKLNIIDSIHFKIEHEKSDRMPWYVSDISNITFHDNNLPCPGYAYQFQIKYCMDRYKPSEAPTYGFRSDSFVCEIDKKYDVLFYSSEKPIEKCDEVKDINRSIPRICKLEFI